MTTKLYMRIIMVCGVRLVRGRVIDDWKVSNPSPVSLRVCFLETFNWLFEVDFMPVIPCQRI